MKKMLLLVISIVTTTLSYSQNAIWPVGNQEYNWSIGLQQSLPTPNGPSGLDYAGQQAQYAANAWHHPQTGALLFFVVDGVVYDNDGYYLGSLDEYNTPFSNQKMRGVSEISIVPDPGDCKRFYVIGGKRNATDSNPIMPPGAVGIPANELNSELFYGVVNLSLPRENYNTNRIGSLELLDDNFNSGYILPLKALIPTNQKYNNASNWSGLDFIAISPKNNNQHFLFYQDKFGLIYTFRINQTGIQYINNSVVDTRTGLAPNFSNPNEYIEHVSRAELEVITLQNGSFRVVGTSYNPIYNSVNNSIQSAQKVYRLDFSTQGTPLISSFTQYQHHSNNSLGQTLIRSIEISPNKNFVYFTSINNNIFERSIYCLDMQTFDLVPLPNISDASTLPFKHSVIERANNGTAEGMLLIAKEDGAYRILNPNTPSTATLSVTPVIPVNLQKSRMNYPNNPWWDDRVGLYLLPDQMDFDPNCQVGCYNFACGDGSAAEACCLFYANYGMPGVSTPYIYGDIVVSSTTSWNPGSFVNGVQIPANGFMKVSGNITIMPGATLTMNGLNIELSPTSKIVVSRGAQNAALGARLRVINSTLTAWTSTCGNCYMWRGIEALGYPNLAQIAPSQAQVTFSVNSRVQYAHFGVLAGKMGTGNFWPALGFAEGGARINATNTTFLNNRYDLFFNPYPSQNASSFNHCVFRTDQNLISSVVTNPIHVYILSNRGVSFYSSKFENTTPINQTTLNRGFGIASNNSNFIVDGPVPSTPSQFNQLNTAIQTYASNSGLFYKVERTQFNKNFRGINSEGEVRPIIKNNTFNVYNTAGFQNPMSETYGVHLRGCNGYQVSKNYFTSTSEAQPNVQVFGCIIDNSGPFPNVVEENTFVGLHTGGVSRRQNAAYSGQKPGGLQWLCNSFSSDKVNDLWVQSGANINPIQGSLTLTSGGFNFTTAGNFFSTINHPNFHLRMESDVPNVFYLHHNVQTLSLVATPNVLSATLNSQRVCGREGDVPNFTENDDIRDVRLTLYDEKSEVEQLIDFGNTDSLILEVLGEYLTAEQKRDLLKQQGISISDDVLIKYMLTDPIHQHLYQVLVYNSPLTDKVIHHMMEESNLPSGMKQQVLLMQTGLSDYEAKQQVIHDYELNIRYLESKYVDAMLSDSTIVYPFENIIAMYEESPAMTYEVQENLFSLYIATQNQQKADSINTILKAMVEDPSYAYLNDLAVMSLQNDFAVLLQDSSIVSMLEMIADQHDYRDAMRAQALLSGYLGYEFEPIAVMGPKNMIFPKYTYDGSVLETVSIFPNPAQDHFFIVFDENADVSQTREVKVYNLSGVLQFTREMQANDYVMEIKTEDMAKGMYLVTISANGKEISTQKVAVR